MLRHHHLIKYLFSRELSEIYISIGMKDLALAMAGIFVPLYLYVDMGYSLNKIFLFFIIYALAMIFSAPLAAKFISRYGVKHGILISTFGLIVYLILLITLPSHNLFYIPPFIWGIANAFYWLSFHTDFAKFSDKKNRGREVSMWFITAFLGVLFGPIIGSIIITYLGFAILFVIVSLLLLLSAVPLFLSSDVYPKEEFNFKYIFKRSHLKDTYLYITMGFRLMIGQLAFPLFIFILLSGYIQLGAIASLSALGSIVVGYFVGKMSGDGKKEKTMFRYGALSHSMGLFGLIFVKTFVQLAVINVYLAISYIFVDIPHHTMVYDKARRERNMMEYFVYREMMLSVGRFLGVFVLLLTGKFVVGFVITGLGMLSWFFL